MAGLVCFDRAIAGSREGGLARRIWFHARKHGDERRFCLRATEGQSATQDRRAACAGVLLQLVAKPDYVLY